MANIRVDIDRPITTGLTVTFRSPVDCSEITGLIVYYPVNATEDGSMTFQFADAHGNNVGDIDHLFTADAIVKVILDIDHNKAYVQNADTNAYLEGKFDNIEKNKADTIQHKMGSTIVANNSAHLPLNGLKVFGKTTQANTTGKNLFDKNAGRYEYTDNNKVYGAYINVSNGLWTAADDASYSIIIPCLPNSDYTISGVQALSILRIATISEYATPTSVYNGIPVTLLHNGGNTECATVTTNSEANYMVVQFASTPMANGAGETIQIELGDTATEYEPYTGGIPSPSPDYPQELESVGKDGSVGVKVSGKNLSKSISASFESQSLAASFEGNTITYNGTSTANVGPSLYDANNSFTLYPGTYTMTVRQKSGKITGTSIVAGLRKPNGGTVKGVYSSYYGGKKTWTFTLTEPTEVSLIFMGNGTYENAVFTVQIEVGETATDFEPYKEPQTLTLPTPNGLLGIGEYCDEIDFARGVRVQRVQEVIFDGTEAWTMAYSGTFFVALHNMSKVLSIPVFCDKYRGTNIRHGIMPDKSVAPYLDNDNKYPGENWLYIHDSAYTSRDSFKNALAANPITVLYVLAQPIETPLTAEQMEAYINAKLHTYAPTTTITNDADADMELTYYTSSTAVQMIHSPADKGKILSIDEHGCVVLTPNEIGSVKDAFQVGLDTYNYSGDDEGFYAGDANPQRELEITEYAENLYLLGRTLHVKTYAYDNAYYGVKQTTYGDGGEEFYEWLVKETPNPNADITKDPKSGVCEFDITIPKDIPKESMLTISVPYEKNLYTELEVYEKKDTVWDEIKKLGVNHIIAHGFYDWGDNNYGYWRKWSDGFVELWTRLYGYVEDYDQIDDEAVVYLSLPIYFDTSKRFHIIMDAWGYSEEDGGNKAPATCMWAEPAYEEEVVTSELFIHVLLQNPAWTVVEGTVYIAGYYYKEEP